MTGHSKIAGAALFACLVSSAALAETGGTITGTMDGETVTWQILSGQSDWTDYGVSIMGRSPEGAPTVMIGFEKNGDQFELPELHLRSEATDHFGNEDTGISLRVERWEAEGETLSLTGAVSGPAYLVTNPVGPELDTGNARALDLTFDLTITNP